MKSAGSPVSPRYLKRFLTMGSHAMPSPFTPPLQALRPVLSVAMAVAAAHALGLHDAWWAAITAFMVMQANFGASLYRGLLRVVGTVVGAALGFVLGPPMA